MSLPLFPIQEIGSLPKTVWRLQAVGGRAVTDDAIAVARSEGERLGVRGHDGLLELLEKRKGFSKADKDAVKQWASRFTLRYLEDKGLDIVYDGEETRTEMYDWPIRHATGFEDRGWVRSWDHLYFRKAAVVAPPRTKTLYHQAEFEDAKAHASRVLKVPITGAYTLADWSYDEHYQRDAGSTPAARRSARRELVLDIARDVIRPNIEGLLGQGAPIIQIDEPAASTKPDEADLFVESFNESVRGLDGTFTVHWCFSDYPLFLPHVLDLENCSQLAIELANRDSWDLGTRREDRPGQEFLHLLTDHGADFDIGLGVIDVHTDDVESPELVRDRILHAAETLGPEKVYVNPDCGLRTRRWPIVDAKLESLVEGTRLAREAWQHAH